MGDIKKTRKPSATKTADNKTNKKIHYELTMSGDKEESTNITFENRKDAEDVMYRNFIKTIDALLKDNITGDVMIFDKKEGRAVISVNVDDEKAPLYIWEISEIAE